MKKRLIICIVLCIISTLCVFGLIACGGTNDNGEVIIDGIVYTLNADKASYTLKKTKNPTADTSLVIPSEINGKPVTAIASFAIEPEHNHFTSITVPDSVTDISSRAFRYCTEIENITVPFVGSTDYSSSSGLIDECFYELFGRKDDYLNEFTKLKKVTVTGENGINDYAFWNCAYLEEIILPDGLTKISDFAFKGCTNLKKIEIPQGVTYIGKEAFMDCKSLKSVVIPDNVTEIASHAFYNCSRLHSVTLGKSVAIIDSNAFNCGKLVEVCNLSSLEIKKGDYYENGKIGMNLQHLYGEDGKSRIEVADDGCVFVSNPDNNKYFLIDYEGSATELVLHKYFGMNYMVWTEAFEFANGVTKITVPEYLSVDFYAFAKMKDLREAVILAEIDNINGMFQYCENLTTVTLAAGVDSFGWEPFKDCNNLKDIYFGGTMEAWNDIYKSADNWKVSNAVTVHCADGNLDRDGNQIS